MPGVSDGSQTCAQAETLFSPVMVAMFEITPDDIAQLNEEDLRALVGHLCESEVRHRQASAKSVTRGGNQNEFSSRHENG